MGGGFAHVPRQDAITLHLDREPSLPYALPATPRGSATRRLVTAQHILHDASGLAVHGRGECLEIRARS
jgi:hypothetical protein